VTHSGIGAAAHTAEGRVSVSGPMLGHTGVKAKLAFWAGC
jgi:hypothetical protein